MHETYRMLGQEHEADLEREAEKWRRAAEIGRPGHASAAAPNTNRRRTSRRFQSARILAFLARVARSEG
jgi:hypothetical protein